MMTKFCIAVILAMCGIPLLAEADYQSGLTNALHLFSSSRYWERMQSTNYINALISSTTNADRIAECRLLKAAVLVECVESELEEVTIGGYGAPSWLICRHCQLWNNTRMSMLSRRMPSLFRRLLILQGLRTYGLHCSVQKFLIAFH